jgi:threonine dehydratase
MAAAESQSRQVSLADVEAAAARLREPLPPTPFLPSATLSELAGCEVWLKFENLQFTGSFKQRGALNKLLSLTQAERARGVVTVSAGNHAQGVAYHASRLGVRATIVMPVTTPSVKVARTRAFGAEVLLTGDSFQDAAAAIPALVETRGLVLVHPYDDTAVIAGQGTVALEMLESGPSLDCVVVPIGGGGLIAGMSIALKGRQPGIEVVGVQTERYPAMATVLGFWHRPDLGGASVAEGIAVRSPGAITREQLHRTIDHVAVVSESRIEEAIALLLQIEKTLCEGAGAAGLAAVLAEPGRYGGRRVGLVLTGGNIDSRLLANVLQRQLVREERLLRFAVALPDQAGSLGMLCSAIGQLGGNIDSVVHDRNFLGQDAKSVRVVAEVEVADRATGQRILEHLSSLGLAPSLLPRN